MNKEIHKTEQIVVKVDKRKIDKWINGNMDIKDEKLKS